VCRPRGPVGGIGGDDFPNVAAADRAASGTTRATGMFGGRLIVAFRFAKVR